MVLSSCHSFGSQTSDVLILRVKKCICLMRAASWCRGCQMEVMSYNCLSIMKISFNTQQQLQSETENKTAYTWRARSLLERALTSALGYTTSLSGGNPISNVSDQLQKGAGRPFCFPFLLHQTISSSCCCLEEMGELPGSCVQVAPCTGPASDSLSSTRGLGCAQHGHTKASKGRWGRRKPQLSWGKPLSSPAHHFTFLECSLYNEHVFFRNWG